MMIIQKNVLVSSEILEITTGITHKVEIISGVGTFKEEPGLNGPVFMLTAYKRDDKGIWVAYITAVDILLKMLTDKYTSIINSLLE